MSISSKLSLCDLVSESRHLEHNTDNSLHIEEMYTSRAAFGTRGTGLGAVAALSSA